MSRNDDPLKKIIDLVMNFFRNKELSDEHSKTNDKIINANKSAKSNNLYNFIVIALVVVLIGLGVSVVSDSFKAARATNLTLDESVSPELMDKVESNEQGIEEYGQQLEDELQGVLEKIDGVGKVDLMIYFESGEEKVPAQNVNDSNSVTNETDNNGGTRKINQDNDGRTVVMINEGDTTKAFVTKTYQPKITGILITAEGAKDKVTRLRIEQAVISLFNLSADKVQVYPMK